LKIAHFDLILGLLLHSAENQKEVPNADADLNAIGIGFAIFGSIDQIKIRLRRCNHKPPSLMGITAKRKWREVGVYSRRAVPSATKTKLNRGRSPFLVADANRFLNLVKENLAVADLAGRGCIENCVHC
jgi:hypothetical protein